MKIIKFGGMANESVKGNREAGGDSPADDCAAFFYKFGVNVFRLFLVVLVSSSFACESPSLKANLSKPEANAAENNVPGFERDLQTMKNADFDFVYVFRRKDGGVFDGEDKKYLKANAPVFTNRFILSDENKVAIAGSSYKFEAGNLENLQKRFVIENFSKPETQQLPANQNSGKQENYDRK